MAKRLVRWRIEGETLVDTADEERSCDVVAEMLGSVMVEANTSLNIEDSIYDTQTVVTRGDIEMLSSELVDRGTK